MIVAKLKSGFKLTTDTPYLALTGEIWYVYCGDLGENWPHYNGTALYMYHHLKKYFVSNIHSHSVCDPAQWFSSATLESIVALSYI